MNAYSYLALGDSYTIGEALDPRDSFPYQAIALLNKEENIEFQEPKIIAVTGWTTDELQEGIQQEGIDGHTFDFVTLLIGVNNQYRGRSADEYAGQFEALLEQAIHFADGKNNRVIVLSIPDWGVTPFAREKEKDPDLVAQEIDTFNNINKGISIRKNVHYIDITFSTRFHGAQDEYLVDDKLHYSALEYKIWAERLSNLIKQQLKDEQK